MLSLLELLLIVFFLTLLTFIATAATWLFVAHVVLTDRKARPHG